MNGINAIAFTAGIGENQASLREEICSYLNWMGVEIDKEANQVQSEEKEISTKNSKIKVWVIPTNEELVIARDTKAIVEKM